MRAVLSILLQRCHAQMSRGGEHLMLASAMVAGQNLPFEHSHNYDAVAAFIQDPVMRPFSAVLYFAESFGWEIVDALVVVRSDVAKHPRRTVGRAGLRGTRGNS